MAAALTDLAEDADAALVAACGAARTAIENVLDRLVQGAAAAEGHDFSALAHLLALSSEGLTAAAARLQGAAADDPQAAGHPPPPPPQAKRARGGELRLLHALPLNLLVDTAVQFIGARELSRLEVAARFVRRSGVVGEVARRLALPRPCWPQVLWRRRERVRALARGFGEDAAAVAQSLRSVGRRRGDRPNDTRSGGTP